MQQAASDQICCKKRSFVSDERGSILITFAFALVVLIFCVGAAIDYSRALDMESRMANALDSATLTTTRDLSFGEIAEDEVVAHLQALYQALAISSGLNEDDIVMPTVSYNRETGVVSASAPLRADTAFLGLAGIEKFDIDIAASAVYSKKEVELVVVVDVTGSMRGSRITALKDAAYELIDILLPADQETETPIRIGIVPYSEGINAGPVSRSMFEHYPDELLEMLPSEERDLAEGYLNRDINGDGQISDLLQRVGGPLSASGGVCFTEKDRGVINDIAPNTASNVLGVSTQASCPSTQIQPLTDDRNQLNSTISRFSTGGWTAGQTGINFGWYMLSPKWNDFWSGHQGPVKEYDDKDVMKVIIVMTDGSFNTYFDNRSGNQRFPNQREYRHTSRSENRAKTACRGLEADGVRIFSVAFQAPGRAKRLMQDCASANGGYYDAASSAALTEAFKSIAEVIRSLHLNS